MKVTNNVYLIKLINKNSQRCILNISVSPEGAGYIRQDPLGGIYDIGTTVTITAHANNGYKFDHWDGDVSGSDPTIQITMDKDKDIIAYFSKSTQEKNTPDLGFAIIIFVIILAIWLKNKMIM